MDIMGIMDIMDIMASVWSRVVRPTGNFPKNACFNWSLVALT